MSSEREKIRQMEELRKQLGLSTSSNRTTSTTKSSNRSITTKSSNIAPTKTNTVRKQIEDFERLREELGLTRESINSRMTVDDSSPEEDIAPVDEKKKWYQKGRFEDGWDFGDLTKTILGINEDSASLLDLTWNSAKKGYYNSRYGEESFKAMDGLSNNKEVYEKLLSGEEYQFTPGSKVAEGVSGAFELIGQQARQFTHPRTLAAAGTAAAGAFALGQAGPQVLAPEEIVTVPGAAIAGFTAGSAAANFQIEAGHAYNEMLEAGISEKTAKRVASAVGGVNAGLELLQVDELVDAYKVAKGSGATKNFAKKILDELVDRGVDVAKETAQEVAQEGVTIAGVQAASKLDKDEWAYNAEDVSNRLLDTAKSSALSFGLMNVPATVKNTVSIANEQKYNDNTLTEMEQKVVDKVYEDKLAEKQEKGEVSKKDQKALYQSVVDDMKKGYIPTDTIEEVLGGETYKSYKDTVDNEDALQQEFDTLNKMKQGDMTGEQIDRRAELKEQLAKITEQSQRNQLKTQLGDEVFSLVKGDNGKGSRLLESYNEVARRRQTFNADLSKYDSKYHATIQNAIDSGLLNNTNRSHEMVDFIAKISADKGVPFNFANNAKIKETGFAVDGAIVNGYRTADGITINVDSPKYLQSTVGHEITHVLEGTELYDSLKETIFNYAKTKGEYDSRMASLTELYKDVKDADIEGELAADLVGDYLFQDSDFVHRLSTENRNIFEKIFDEIKYLCRVATAGSKEARELEKVKKIFEDAYRSGANTEVDADFVEYSLDNNPNKKYNKKRKYYNEARSLFMQWENGSASPGEVKIFVLEGKTRYFQKTESGSVELSKKQYIERDIEYGENCDRRAEREIGKTSYYDGSTQRGSLGNDNFYSDSGTNASVFGQAFREEFSDVSSRSLSDVYEDNRGNALENPNTNEEASEDSGASVTFSNDYAFYRNYLKEGDTGEQYSLGDTNRRYGEYTTSMKDIALESDKFDAPTMTSEAQDGVIPTGSVVKASDRNNYGIVESYNPETDTYLVNFKSKGGFTATVEFDAEQLTHVPTANEQYHSYPDVEQFEYENAEAVRVATENRLSELAEMDVSDPEIADEYNKVLEAWVESKTKLLELDEKFAEQADSITDADAPPEKKFDAPVKPEPKIAKVLEKPSKKKNRGGLLHSFANKFVDKGNAVEKLSLDTGNMELQAKWNSALPTYTDSMAQHFMENGTDKVPALKKILAEQNKSGKTHAFNEYMNHLRNVDSMTLQERLNLPNKPVFGNSVTADISRKKVAEWEKKNPEFKRWAQQYYDISNYLLDELVKEGLLTQESADYLRNKYPHYIPLKRAGVTSSDSDVVDTRKAGVGNTIKTATGSNADLEPLGNAMAERIQQHYHAIAKNRFGVELKNTLNSVVEQSKNLMKADDFLDAFEGYEEGLLNRGRVNGKPTFTVYENGNRVEFEITDELYDSLEPTKQGALARVPGLAHLSDIRRKLLTTWNPVFSLYRNPVKDLQDVMINSQHPAKTYANIPGAMLQLLSGGEFANEYHKNGGMSNTYYDSQKSRFKFEDNMFKKVFGMPFRAIEAAGEFIEQVPRLAEYMASRKNGRSIERSMLDAARVTTNFAAGGDYTKLINRNGVPFLNASVQGAAQHVRNFRESAKIDGFKGVVKTLSKYVIAGVPAVIFNNLIWDDDEEYEELNEYVKDNYYVVAKTDDGKFIRIPKGRTSAVIQEGLEQMKNLVTGDDEADFNTFFELFLNNIAPNNPLKDNIFAPLVQTISNNAWYSADIVPERLQDLPAEEQYDESTDFLSKWLGEKLKVSPMKINYLLDQYSGGIGDVALPMMTPEAESGDDSLAGNLLAPWKKEMTTDSVLNNKNPGEFFDLADEVKAMSNSKIATEEDKMKSMYLQSVGYDISDLYAQKREIQSGNEPASYKYDKIRALQEQINELAKNAIKSYEDVSVNGLYSEVADKRYNYDAKYGKWYEISPTNADGTKNWYYDKEQKVTKGLGISYKEYWNNKEEYNFQYDYPEKHKFLKSIGISVSEYLNFDDDTKSAYSWVCNNPDEYTFSKVVTGDVVTYKKYTTGIWDLEADKDANGKAVYGSKKTKVIDYLNGLDADYGEKIILFKKQYPADDTYNREIVEYLNSRKDISYKEKVSILKELEFKIDSDGNVTW